MRESSSHLTAGRPSPLSRRPGSVSRPSADLAGRSVRISAAVPALFDAPLAAHHKMIGRWAAGRHSSAEQFTRHEARTRIEKVFDAAVLDILKTVELADFRVVVLEGDDHDPPALAVICDSMGQLELGWIEKSNVLSQTLFEHVAPVRWRAHAYDALVSTLKTVLPIFSYVDLFEEVSMYYWDGADNDEDAIRHLKDYHGADAADLDGFTLPSEMNARRPDFMLAENKGPLKHLPAALRERLSKLREAQKAVADLGPTGNAWDFDRDLFDTYIPGSEDSSWLPPMTLVPFDHFQRELDDVTEHAMQTSFMDCAGICPLNDPAEVDAWLHSLKLGADFLAAAQALIDLDPSKI